MTHALLAWCAASLCGGAAWAALAVGMRWAAARPVDRRHTVHVHRLALQESCHPYFGTTKLTWCCQTCPHREFLGMVWPDATNRAAA